MQIGDEMILEGTVKDIVGGSTLIATADGHEYWILSLHCLPKPPVGTMPPVEVTPIEGKEAEEAPDLEEMTKDELVTYAHKKLNLKLDGRKAKDELINEIEERRAEVGAQ